MEQIAHYRVKSRLGAGGMGEVYLATDEKLGRDVALKLLPDAMTADAGARARLVREARTASALNHPNICHIYEVGEAGGHAYIAMEHIEGRPLSQSIPADGLPIEKAQLFLRGQFDVPRAQEMLKKALEADPKFADARAMYALTHYLQLESGVSNETAWIYKAEQEVQQALRDDPDSLAAQAILGGVYLLQGKRDIARQHLQRVFDRDPRQQSSRVGLLQYYRLSGEYPAGIALARETLEFIPVFMIGQLLLGSMLHQSGDSAAAVRAFVGVLDQDPQNFFALRELARGHIETGDTKTARMFLERVRKSDRQNYRVRLVWALLYAREGKHREAMKEMDAEVQKYAEVNPNVTLEAAEFFAILGEKTKALDWLEKAVRNGDERTAWFQRDPLLESIRGESRFRNILDSIAYRRQHQ